SSSSPTSSTGMVSYFQFNLGVQGDADWLALYIGRMPSELLQGDLANNPDQQVQLCDQRRIAYWLVGSHGVAGHGLARQEITGVTSSNDLTPLPPSVSDEQTFVIAQYVRNVTFEYYDGTAWQTSWDGTALSTVDNKTPVGPPAAIRITVVVAGSL